MKTSNIESCINICKNNPNYRLDGYLAENELIALKQKIETLKQINEHINSIFNNVANDLRYEYTSSMLGSDQDENIQIEIDNLNGLIKFVNETVEKV